MSDRTLTVEEAAAQLRVGKYTIYRWLKLSPPLLRAKRVGKFLRIPQSEVDSLLALDAPPEPQKTEA